MCKWMAPSLDRRQVNKCFTVGYQLAEFMIDCMFHTGDAKWLVEKILSDRTHPQSFDHEYFVQWVGWSERCNSWESHSAIDEQLIKKYEDEKQLGMPAQPDVVVIDCGSAPKPPRLPSGAAAAKLPTTALLHVNEKVQYEGNTATIMAVNGWHRTYDLAFDAMPYHSGIPKGATILYKGEFRGVVTNIHPDSYELLLAGQEHHKDVPKDSTELRYLLFDVKAESCPRVVPTRQH